MPSPKGTKKKDETKKNMQKSAEARILKQAEEKKELTKLEGKLIEKEYKEGLKDHLEQQLFDLKYKIKRVDPDNKLTLIEIDRLLRGKSLIGGVLYSAEELSLLFDYYREFIGEINKVTRYIPSKKNFCGFAKMSSSTYDSYLINGDAQKVEIMKMIDDYITDISLTLAQHREIDNATTMFRAKAEHGMIEATAPIVIKREEQVNLDEIREQIKALKAGKSLRAIELTEENYKIGGDNE